MMIPELLAPAGNAACVIAAVQNGADAVYLGLKQGSARAGAENFTWDELEETLQYAHKRHCRVYLAINTLFTETELPATLSDAKKAGNLGVDALIVQDLGLGSRLLQMRAKGELPAHTEIHASTQMSIAAKEGAAFLKSQGYDRLITARELSIEELTELCQGPLPVECFIHGALCMSYSGQCLLSSFIGGRSGNKGACAQPCRMAYRLDGQPASHVLSPKDFCALPLLDQVVATGVASLKIEGRLKAPEYTALTTSIYRKALDSINAGTFEIYRDSGEMAADIERLELQFSRGHFTQGYLLGKIPKQDITYQNPGRKGLELGKMRDLPRILPRPKTLPKDLQLLEINCGAPTLVAGDGVTVLDAQEQPFIGGTVNKVTQDQIVLAGTWTGKMQADRLPATVFVTHSVNETEQIRRTFTSGAERPRIGLTGYFTARKGDVATLTLSDSQDRAGTAQSSAPVEAASNTPTGKERIEAQLGKFGGTPYFMQALTIEMDSDIFLPIGVINTLRREALASLETCHIEKAACANPVPEDRSRPAPTVEKGRYTLYYYREQDFLEEAKDRLASYKPYIIYVPYTLWEDATQVSAALEKAHRAGARLVAAFPLLPLGPARETLKQLLPTIVETADGVQLTNLSDFELLPRALSADFLVCGDFSFNVTNQESARVLQQAGLQVLTLSPEAAGLKTHQIAGEVLTEGPIPLMRTRHCILRKDKPHCGLCRNEKKWYTITDGHGVTYPVLPKPKDCQNIILSPKAFPVHPDALQTASLKRINILKEFQP